MDYMLVNNGVMKMPKVQTYHQYQVVLKFAEMEMNSIIYFKEFIQNKATL